MAEVGAGRESGEPVFGRFRLATRPLDQEPLLWMRLASPIIAMGRPDSQRREARTKTLFCSFPPGHGLPGRSRQTVRPFFDGHRLMPVVSSLPLAVSSLC